ncbi:hypothetical protein JMJ55_30675, partial [Belnapia sp. T6]
GAVEAVVSWLQRGRVDWLPAARPDDSAARLARFLDATLTRQATAAGLRLPPETLAALRTWLGLPAPRPTEAMAAEDP